MYYETIEKFFEEKTYKKYTKRHKNIEAAWKTYLYKNKRKIYNKKTNNKNLNLVLFNYQDIAYLLFYTIGNAEIEVEQDQLKKLLHNVYKTKKPNKLNQNKLKCLG